MSVVIRSFLSGRKGLIPIEEVKEAVKDPDYVEGALSLSLNGVEVLKRDQGMVDYVDQLWAYFTTALVEAYGTGRAEFHFPDQPLLVRVRIFSGQVIRISVGDSHPITGSADLRVFLSAFHEQGMDFYKRMAALNPSHQSAYEHYARQLEALYRLVNGSGERG